VPDGGDGPDQGVRPPWREQPDGGVYPGGAAQPAATRQQLTRSSRNQNHHCRCATVTYLQRGPNVGSALKQQSTIRKLPIEVRGGVVGQPQCRSGDVVQAGARHTSEAAKLRVPQGVRRCPSVCLWRHHRASRRTQLHQHQLVNQRCVAASMQHRHWQHQQRQQYHAAMPCLLGQLKRHLRGQTSLSGSRPLIMTSPPVSSLMCGWQTICLRKSKRYQAALSWIANVMGHTVTKTGIRVPADSNSVIPDGAQAFVDLSRACGTVHAHTAYRRHAALTCTL
jgi:hypothetical protein